MSVMNIFERAQIGALVRYRDFAPQPPANDVEAFGAEEICVDHVEGRAA